MQRTLKALFLCLGLLLPTISLRAETVAKFVTKEDKIREQMVTISRELGVTCTACHNVQNFTSDEKKTFKVGREHIKLTQMLKDNGFDGQKNKPEATCYMCHRGKIIPDYKEPASNKAH